MSHRRRTATLVAMPLLALPWLPAEAHAASPPYGDHSNDALAPCPAGTAYCPSDDPFFHAPADLASLPDGTLVGTRPATLGVANPAVAEATTITYRSTDTFGAPVLDSGTVMIPAAPWTGPGPRPLVSEQFAEDSDGGQCAPSNDLADPEMDSNVTAEQAGIVTDYLTHGIVVVAPDFEGPAQQYEVGGQSGHAVLDGVRAAETLPAAGLTATTPVVLNGYSGGAFATGWGAELAATYAPKLDIVGASMGGTPANQQVTAEYLDGTAFAGLVFLVSVALNRGYPALGITRDLNPAGKALFATLSSACVGVATDYAYQRFNQYTTTPNLIETPAFTETLAFDDLGQHPPTFPILDYHVLNDEIVPYDQDQALVATYCAAGTPVEGVTLAGDHVSGEVEGAPLAQAFALARFDGLAPVDTCGLTDQLPPLPQTPPVTSPTSALPESPSLALLGLAGFGAGAGVWAWRRRRHRPAS